MGAAECWQGFVRCMGRIPCASLIAFVLFGLGITVYIGAALSAFNIVSEFFDLNINVKAVIIPLYIVFLALAVCFIIFAFLSTGETRKEVCKGECCNITGRILQAVTIVITWILNLGWVVISGATVIPTLIFLMAKLTCETSFIKGLSKCITIHSAGYAKNNTICGQAAAKFCHNISDINMNLIIAYISSLIVCISLVQFLMTMSANYVHMKDELEDKTDKEEYEKVKP